MKNKNTQANKLLNLKILRNIKMMTVITALFLLLILSSCAAQQKTNKTPIIIPCRQTVITYGDAVECMIRLDEAQYTP